MAYNITDSSVRYMLSLMNDACRSIRHVSDFSETLRLYLFIDFCVNFLYRSGYFVSYDDLSGKYKIFK